MKDLKDLVRPNVWNLKPYSSARDEFHGDASVFLDANENPFASEYNRYPDPYQRELKQQVARLKGVDVSRLVLGNGSDELIDMLIRTVCVPGRDNIIVFSPGYSMYEVSARVNGTEVRNLVLDDDFMPEWERIFERVDERTKIIFFCTPNNPVGNVIPLDGIRRVALRFDGLVVVDEAYIDFADVPSATSLRGECPNVVVLQTLSKAWGLAGLRVGICMAEPGLVKYLNKVKPPYNIGSVTQRMALEALKNVGLFRERVEEIKRERERVFVALRGMACFERVYDSEANFLLACTPRYREVYDYLLAHGLVVRVRHIPPRLEGGLRVTIGTREENDLLIRVLKDFR